MTSIFPEMINFWKYTNFRQLSLLFVRYVRKDSRQLSGVVRNSQNHKVLPRPESEDIVLCGFDCGRTSICGYISKRICLLSPNIRLGEKICSLEMNEMTCIMHSLRIGKKEIERSLAIQGVLSFVSHSLSTTKQVNFEKGVSLLVAMIQFEAFHVAFLGLPFANVQNRS